MSEILFMILLLITVFLYRKTVKLQQQVDQLLSREQLENVLDSFIDEMKADNSLLLEQFQSQTTSEADLSNGARSKLPSYQSDEGQYQVEEPVVELFNQRGHLYALEKESAEKRTGARIVELAQNGADTKQIAKQLSMGVAEVDMILQFKKKKSRN